MERHSVGTKWLVGDFLTVKWQYSLTTYPQNCFRSFFFRKKERAVSFARYGAPKH